MPTLFHPATRDAVLARVQRLSPDGRPAWGRMTAPRMVVHVTDQLRMALGDVPSTPIRGPLRNPVLRFLIVHVLPWPKGTPTAPELLARAPGSWDDEVSALRDAIHRFVANGPWGTYTAHPAFGVMKGPMWGALAWRHLDHHLRQFGV